LENELYTKNDRGVSIEFVNHASVVISYGDVSLLSDPWYFGSAFGHGWSLLYENDDRYIRNLVDRVQFIWYSHEHSDHFSVPFLQKYEKVIQGRGIKILYQETKDNRVIDFLENRGFEVITIRNGQEFELTENYIVRIQKVHVDDSALICDVKGVRIVNINDCTLDESVSLKWFKKKCGTCDVLLTQFGYAAWRRTPEWRQVAAKKKLRVVKLQAQFLEPKVIIPFASFIYFSNSLNNFMNDHINTPQKVVEGLDGMKGKLCFMHPEEVRDIKDFGNDEQSLKFWSKRFENIDKLPVISFPKSVPIFEIAKSYKKFTNNILMKNNVYLIRLLSFIPFMNFFSKLRIYLVDLDKYIILDIFGIFENADCDQVDLEMHSFSLNQMLCDEYGFDTLMVNGCFKAKSKQSERKLINTFAVTKLNQIGYRLDFSTILSFGLVYRYLKTFWRTLRENH